MSSLRSRFKCPLALFAAAAALTFVSGCAPKTTPPAAPPDVGVAQVDQKDEQITAEWIGTTDGYVNAEIRPQVTGYLMRQAYPDGASVKKGQLLFEIDPRTFQATYDRVKADFVKAELDLKRQTELLETAAAAREDYDNAEQAELAAKAALEQAQLDLDFTKVVSPVDGIAGIAQAQIGNLVSPSGGALTTVSTVDPIKVIFSISEQSYLDFRQSQTDGEAFSGDLSLILSDGSAYPHRGKVYAWDRQVDGTTGTMRVVGVFPNPGGLLRTGQYARVRAVVRTQKGALLVPQRAVSEIQGGYQVVTVDEGNHAHFNSVQVGDRVGSEWIVTGGLHPGDRIVVEGLQKVKEGGVVNPLPFAGN
jgi:membrane fusion protein, multidrug efflux system